MTNQIKRTSVSQSHLHSIQVGRCNDTHNLNQINKLDNIELTKSSKNGLVSKDVLGNFRTARKRNIRTMIKEIYGHIKRQNASLVTLRLNKQQWDLGYIRNKTVNIQESITNSEDKRVKLTQEIIDIDNGKYDEDFKEQVIQSLEGTQQERFKRKNKIANKKKVDEKNIKYLKKG